MKNIGNILSFVVAIIFIGIMCFIIGYADELPELFLWGIGLIIFGIFNQKIISTLYKLFREINS